MVQAMSRIPRIAHFVFGLRVQDEPFHLLQYLAIESCRRVVAPAEIKVHLEHLPWGVYWDLIRPHVTVERVASPADLPVAFPQYHYAHRADVVRLDVLEREGGLYADIDTIFVRPIPDRLWEQSAVIGEEHPVQYAAVAEPERSLSNALLMAEPGAPFVREWRRRIVAAMDGSWSGHSCRLATLLADERPGEVHVEPQSTFHAIAHTIDGLRGLLEEPPRPGLLEGAISVHTCAHLWWAQQRRDFSAYCAHDATAAALATADTTLARLARPFLPG